MSLHCGEGLIEYRMQKLYFEILAVILRIGMGHLKIHSELHLFVEFVV